MLIGFFLILGMAALFGFLLGVYFFLYRVNLGQPFRTIGAVVGGSAVALLMVGVTLVVLWPPVEVMLSLVALVFAGIITAVTLGGKPRTQNAADAVTETVADNSDRSAHTCSCSFTDGRNVNEGVGSYSLDFDISPGS